MFSQNPKLEQQRQLQRLSQSLPDGLPTANAELVELATNSRKLQQLREKCNTTTNPTELSRLQDNQKKYINMTLGCYKLNFMELDRMHTKAIVELKLLLQKVEKLEKFRAVCTQQQQANPSPP